MPTIFWLADIPVPGEIVIAHSFDPKFISLSSPSLIVITVFNTLGYLSQLFFRLYLKFFKNNEESNELLQWYLVIILGIVSVIPTVSILLELSIYLTLCVLLILQFVVIPGMALLCHEKAHQYYFSNHPNLQGVLLHVKQTSEKICLPQPQQPEPNLHEPVTIDDMALESNIRVMAKQAAARLTLAQQAIDLQTKVIYAQYSQENEKNPKLQKQQVQKLVQHPQSQMSKVEI